jgi:2-polyprenyl-3-methyl-5-hydroxy-6-metoxy-1,4-benzoquinol methylase
MMERVALACGKVPVPVLDAVLGPLQTRAIMTGVSLGVFEALRDGANTAAGLALQLGLDTRALDLLLRTLVMSDYLVQRGDSYALSPMGRKTMVTDAPMQMVGYLRFNYAQWEFIEHLEELVRTGRGRDFHTTMIEPGRWRDYQIGMLEMARIESPLVAARVPVRRSAMSLLDLAGAHGLFGAAVCQRHPPMRCTVLELPQAIPHARALAAEEGLGDVVTHREGDALTSDLGCHDVVLMFNFLHHFSEDTVRSLIRRAHAALKPDGTVAIWEIEASRKDSRATSADQAALFFRLTSTAGAHHGDDYTRWLREAGFQRVTRTRPVASFAKVLVTARR